MKNITEALNLITNYLVSNYSSKELSIISNEVKIITNRRLIFKSSFNAESDYIKLQDNLAHLNEKETIRKSKGVYYTPLDVVRFILYNSIKNYSAILKPNNIHVMDLNGVDYKNFCYRKTIFDIYTTRLIQWDKRECLKKSA